MRLLFSSILVLLLSFSIDGQDSVADEKCGRSTPIKDNFIVESSNKAKRMIFGGNEVGVGKWPWQVLITISMLGNPEQQAICGGTIIANRWILTAAHCLDITKPDYVLYGSVVKMNPDEAANNTVYPKSYKIHEYYETEEDGIKRQESYYNDIALIELNQSIPFDHTASAICLPSRNTKIPEDGQVIATGFGRTNDRSNLDAYPPAINRSDKLLETVIPLFPQEQCEIRWNKLKENPELNTHLISSLDSHICGGTYGHGTGKGDSGGPAVMYSKSGRWFQVGVTSFGLSESDYVIAQDISPGFYTNVEKFCDWIEENTRGEAKCQDAELVDATAAPK